MPPPFGLRRIESAARKMLGRAIIINLDNNNCDGNVDGEKAKRSRGDRATARQQPAAHTRICAPTVVGNERRMMLMRPVPVPCAAPPSGWPQIRLLSVPSAAFGGRSKQTNA